MSPRASKLALPLFVAALATVLAFDYGCEGNSIASDADASISVVAPAEVELGKAFPVTIVRSWPKGSRPGAFDERALAPLVTRLESSSIRDDDARVEETRRYLGFAFSFDAVVIPSIPMEVATGTLGGGGKSARSEPLRIGVRTALDPKAPGEPEGPGAPLEAPSPWQAWSTGTLALLVLTLLVRARRRRTAGRTSVPPDAPTAAGPGPEVTALAELARLRGSRRGADAALAEAGDVVRRYAAERYALPALKMTSRELVAAIPSLRGNAGLDLSRVLGMSDLVKFAEHAPTTEDRDGALDAAEAFVRATTGSEP